MSTPSSDSHIVALHQALIPNWTSPAFSKFVDATRALVDELANITTTRDGKEEMLRCEEIFKQICWLEERFWPDVDGMGEEDETAALGASGLGGLDGATFAGPMNQNMTPMNSQSLTGQMSGQMNGQGMNSQMNGTMANGMNGSNMNGTPMNSNINGNMNGNDGTPGSDGPSNFGQMGQMSQSS